MSVLPGGYLSQHFRKVPSTGTKKRRARVDRGGALKSGPAQRRAIMA